MDFDRVTKFFVIAALCIQAGSQLVNNVEVAAVLKQLFASLAFLAAASFYASVMVPKRAFEVMEGREKYVFFLRASATSLLVATSFFGLAWASRFLLPAGSKLLVFIVLCGLLNQVTLLVSLFFFIYAIVSYYFRFPESDTLLITVALAKQKGLIFMKLALVVLLLAPAAILFLFLYATSTGDPYLLMVLGEVIVSVFGLSFLLFAIGVIRFFWCYDTPNKGAAHWIHFGTAVVVIGSIGCTIIFGLLIAVLDYFQLQKLEDVLLPIASFISGIIVLGGCALIVAGIIRSLLPFGLATNLPISSEKQKLANIQ
jgi:hypothetical protein